MSSNLPIGIPDLSDANMKLQRARAHISDIRSWVQKRMSADKYTIRIEPNDKTGRHLIVFKSLCKADTIINTLIGDAVGNLRSALDYAIVALVSPIIGRTDNIGFPFADHASGFKGQVKSERCLGHCSPSIQEWFISDIQAYDGGSGHEFWVINKLRNIDKHRLLLSTLQIAGLVATFKDANNNTFTIDGPLVEAGQTRELVSSVIPNLQLVGCPKFSLEVIFKEPPYAEGRAVLLLEEAANKTEDLLNALRKGAERGNTANS